MDDDDEPVYDEDNPEWTDENSRPLRDSERLKFARVRLGLTQAEMAALLRVPAESVQDWEERRAEPEGPARTLIALLHHDPQGVRALLEKAPA